ncbi:MAG: hypothetical protein ACE366_03415 [Bradymonadia bacterium]
MTDAQLGENPPVCDEDCDAALFDASGGPVDMGFSRDADVDTPEDAGGSEDAEMFDAALMMPDAKAPPAPWPGPCEILETGPHLGEGVQHRWRFQYADALLVETTLDLYDDGDPDYRQLQSWRPDGQLLEIVTDFSADDRPDFRATRVYDDDLHVRTDIASSGEETDTRETWWYNPVEPVARLVRVETDRGLDGRIDETLTLEYDLAGRVSLRRWVVRGDPELRRSEAYIYDRQSRLIRINEDVEDDGEVDRWTIWRYDEGLRVPNRRSVDTDGDGIIDHEERWWRDASGNIITREEDRRDNGQIDLIATYDYSCWME